MPAFFFMKNHSPIFKDPIEQEIAELVEPVLLDMGYELVEVQFRRESHGQVLRLIIYKESGIGVDDCAKVSREISLILDVEELIDQAYNLEVSSPGLDRPLVSERDFARYLGKKVRLMLIDSSEELIGTIDEVSEGKVTVTSGDTTESIKLHEIMKARLEIGF